jgi:spore coat protein H
MRKSFIFVFILFAVVFQSCFKEEIIFNADPDRKIELPMILKINNRDCSYDFIENSLRYPIEHDITDDFTPLIEFQTYSNVYFEGIKLKNKTFNNLGTIEINKAYEVIIESIGETQKFALTFTNLPIVQIIAPNPIFDEPKTIAKIVINYAELNKLPDSYYMGIEYRGSTSLQYYKKSFGISLKGSISMNNNISASCFEMKESNEWILDAMWIDKARMRNITSFKLWNSIVGNTNEGINGKFVELYINNEHQGLYCFSEKINTEFLHLNNPGAVLYKAVDWGNGATRFETYSGNAPLSYYWDGWEQKHPSPKIEINWIPLNELRQLVVTENDTVFMSKIPTLANINNIIDYYLFLNLISAMDNSGKNTFLVKESVHEKFRILPWDLDGSWGIFWDGTQVGHTSILSNNLFDRLMETNTDNFRNKLKQRWFSLRGTVFSETELKNLFIEHFSEIEKSGIIDIENRKWESNIDFQSELDYLIDWIEKRVIFLDLYFDDL